MAFGAQMIPKKPKKDIDKMKKPELLIPAGSLPVLKTAVVYGADAVYIGGEAFSLRAAAKNFTNDEIRQGLAFAHERGVKVYVTANIFAHNRDLKEIEAYFEELARIRPDGVLVSDPGVFNIARRVMGEIELHISTQANNTNYETFNFWYSLGVRRVVCARELSLAEIAQIRANIPEDMEIEAFVHGAMCISYSGRCLLSAYMTGRSANEGACTHPCRWKYALQEESRPGEYMPVFENERGTYIFNSKDLCMIDHLPEMVRAGIDSLKVEGRMKSALYVASVARTYRMAIDDYFEELNAQGRPDGAGAVSDMAAKTCSGANAPAGTAPGAGNSGKKAAAGKYGLSAAVPCPDEKRLPAQEKTVPENNAPQAQAGPQRVRGKYSLSRDFYRSEISKCTYREYTTGFFFGRCDETAQIYDESTYVKEWVYLGMAGTDERRREGRTYYGLEQKNKFSVGETVEIMKPSGENIQAAVLDMEDENGNKILSCPHPKQHFYADFGCPLEPYDIIRKKS